MRELARRTLGGDYRRVPFGVARGARLPSSRGMRCTLGLYELELVRYLRALVQPSAVCYDVGAAGGYYAVALARRAARGKVICFEPEGDAYAELRDTLQRNPDVASRVQPVNQRLGNNQGDGATTLDAFVAESGKGAEPNFLKIDVDGPEHDVLLGGAEVIDRCRPRFIIETHGFEVEARCLRFLTERGYGYRVVNPRRIWPEHRPIEVNRWVVAVPRADPAFPLVCH